jgi:hypothetical protein
MQFDQLERNHPLGIFMSGPEDQAALRMWSMLSVDALVLTRDSRFESVKYIVA